LSSVGEEKTFRRLLWLGRVYVYTREEMAEASIGDQLDLRLLFFSILGNVRLNERGFYEICLQTLAVPIRSCKA
jgi:hypothetical protein